MDLTFKLGCHGDIALFNRDEPYNLGYRCYLKLPALAWLAYVHQTNKNTLSNISIPSIVIDDEDKKEVDNVLKTTLKIAKKLPLLINEFNNAVYINGLAEFTPPNNDISNKFTISDLGYLVINKYSKELKTNLQTLDIQISSIPNLLISYLEFSTNTVKLGVYQKKVPLFYDSLKRTSIIN